MASRDTHLREPVLGGGQTRSGVTLLEWVWSYWGGCDFVRVGVVLLGWVWPY